MKQTVFVVSILGALVISCSVAPNAAAGDYPISLDCMNEKKKGTMHFNVELDGDNLVFTAKYPVSIASLIGGFEGGGKTFSPNVTIYLDVDNDPETGMEKDETFEPGQGGCEYMVGADEVTTSVARDADGNWISKPKLMVEIEKMEESVELPEGVYPEWEFKVDGEFQEVDWVEPQQSDTMRLVVPVSVFGLKAGDEIRASAATPSCNTSFPFTAAAEAKITLNPR